MSPRTTEQNKEIRQQTRKKILDAAFGLFANEGYIQTSISAIARKAGISKGLIYHYFESKEAILEGIFDGLVEFADEMLDFPEHFSATDKIRQVLEQTFDFIENQTGTGKLMISLVLQTDTIKTLKSKIDEINKTQTVLFMNIFEELGYEYPETEAYKLGALLDGMLLGYATMGDEYPFYDMKNKLMEEYVSN